MKHTATAPRYVPQPDATQVYPDDEELEHFVVLVVLEEPLTKAEARQVREALAEAARSAGGMACNVKGNPLGTQDPKDQQWCGFVVAHQVAEDGVDAMEEVLQAIPREHVGLVAINASEIDTVETR